MRITLAIDGKQVPVTVSGNQPLTEQEKADIIGAYRRQHTPPSPDRQPAMQPPVREPEMFAPKKTVRRRSFAEQVAPKHAFKPTKKAVDRPATDAEVERLTGISVAEFNRARDEGQMYVKVGSKRVPITDAAKEIGRLQRREVSLTARYTESEIEERSRKSAEAKIEGERTSRAVDTITNPQTTGKKVLRGLAKTVGGTARALTGNQHALTGKQQDEAAVGTGHGLGLPQDLSEAAVAGALSFAGVAGGAIAKGLKSAKKATDVPLKSVRKVGTVPAPKISEPEAARQRYLEALQQSVPTPETESQLRLHGVEPKGIAAARAQRDEVKRRMEAGRAPETAPIKAPPKLKEVSRVPIERKAGKPEDALPEKEGVFVGTDQTTRFRKPIYREASPAEFVDRGYKLSGTFWSDNPDLALGQGANKGVVYEFLPTESARFMEHQKPGTAIPGVGKEYRAISQSTVNGDIPGKLVSVTVKKGVQIPAQMKVNLKTFADPEVLPNGDVKYTFRPTKADVQAPPIIQARKKIAKTAQPAPVEPAAPIPAAQPKSIAKKPPLEVVEGGKEDFRDELDDLIEQHLGLLKENKSLKSSDRFHADTAMRKLKSLQRPTETELKALSKAVGEEFATVVRNSVTGDMKLRRMPRGKQSGAVNINPQKIRQNLREALKQAPGLHRSLVTFGDLSASLNQGGLLLRTHPKAWGKAFGEQMKAIAKDPLYARQIEDELEKPKDPLIKQLREIGQPYIARDADSVKDIGDLDENWANRLTGTPLFVKDVDVNLMARSERGFRTMGNVLRTNVFDELALQAVRARGGEIDEKAIKWIGDYVNVASGRGKLPGKLEELAPELGWAFFAPRYVMSRIQYPIHLAKGLTMAETRKMAAKELAKAAGTTYVALKAAEAAGAEVEWDPRSSDFLKVKIGNTRVDITAGMATMLRYAGQVVTGQGKGDGKPYPKSRWDTVLGESGFVRSKLAPVPGLIVDELTGKTFIGEEVSAKTRMERFIPMTPKDIVEAFQEHGPAGALFAPTAILGAGTNTYKKSIRKKKGMGPPSAGPKFPSMGPGA